MKNLLQAELSDFFKKLEKGFSGAMTGISILPAAAEIDRAGIDLGKDIVHYFSLLNGGRVAPVGQYCFHLTDYITNVGHLCIPPKKFRSFVAEAVIYIARSGGV